MDTRDLSAAVLADLRRPRPYPAVSVLVNTHRREPDNAGDRVRLRNQIAEAKRLLTADPGVTRADRVDLVRRLERAAEDVDLVHARDGLLILAAPGEQQTWMIDRAVSERVVLSTTYVTRNLVAAKEALAPFWVLDVTAERVTLWGGDDEDISADQLHGFPVVADGREVDIERRERKGDEPSIYQTEQTKQHLRAADAALGRLLKERPRPVLLVGEANALAAITDVGGNAKHAAAQVAKVVGGTPSAAAVLELVRPAMIAYAREQAESALRALSQALGRKEFAAGIDEVWRMVGEGRVARLLVEEHYWEWVREIDGHLLPAAEDDPGAYADAVDEVVERALDTGAEVTFLPDDSLVEQGRVAAILRY
jgi:hypothetical protein